MKQDNKTTLGLLIPEFYDLYKLKIFEGIKGETDRQNTRLICFLGGALEFSYYPHSERNPIYGVVNERNVDCIILMTGSLMVEVGHEGIQKFLKKFKGIPVISIAIELPGIPSVVIDNETGFYQAISHLIKEHGCKYPAFIKGPDLNDEARIRYATYKKCLLDHKIPFRKELVYEGEFKLGDGERAVKELVDNRKVYFDALIGADDHMILNALEPLKQRGIKLPGDVMLCGFDDIEYSANCDPPLTTVRQPLYDLGVASVKLALDKLKGEEVPFVTRIPTVPVIRTSCGCSIEGILKVDLKKRRPGIYTLKDKEIEQIREKVKKKYEQLNLYFKESYICKFVYIVIDSLCDAIKSRSIKAHLNTAKSIFLDTADKGFSLSYWENILSLFIRNIDFESYTPTDNLFIMQLFNETMILLLKTEARNKTFKTRKLLEITEHIQRISDNLITNYKESIIFKVLDDNLSQLRINKCLIALFTDIEDTLKIFYCKDGMENVDFHNIEFNFSDLYPDSISFFNDVSVVVIPLLSEYSMIGFIIMELCDIDKIIYEALVEKISMAIINARLMRKIRNHTLELETEVERRTEELKETNKLLTIANNLLTEQSFKDQLTDLYNRRYLTEEILPIINDYLLRFLPKGEKMGKRDENNTHIAIFMIDIDYFKSINDTHGHFSGDIVLKAFSRILLDNARISDFVVRMGGEEFLIVMRDFNPDNLAEKAEKIRLAIENYEFIIENDKKIHCTSSIGCMTLPVDCDCASSIDLMSSIILVDKALYHAKKTGRNKGILIQIQKSCFDNELIQDCDSDNFQEFLNNGLARFKDAKLIAGSDTPDNTDQ